MALDSATSHARLPPRASAIVDAVGTVPVPERADALAALDAGFDAYVARGRSNREVPAALVDTVLTLGIDPEGSVASCVQ